MDATDINGGNIKVIHKEVSTEIEILNASDKLHLDDEKLSDHEISSDVQSLKKSMSLMSKRKLRKSKTYVQSTHEAQELPILFSSQTRRKTFEGAELSSGESEEFNGFDLNDFENLGHENIVLKKLLDEAELMSNFKRRKTSMTLWKPIKNDTACKENDEHIIDSDSKRKITKATVLNETVSESSINLDKSLNSSNINSNRLRKNRFRASSPNTTTRQKVSIDITNPAYKEPFKYGWKRELVYRAGGSENQTRRMADIYYYTPEGKKVRSYREVIEFLTTSELTIDNFTFFKEPLGVNDSSKEIIRDAKKAKDFCSSKVNFKASKKTETPLKKAIIKRGVDKSIHDIEHKTIKSINTPETFKVKLPTKKTALKKETAGSPNTNISTKDDVPLSPSKKCQPIEKSPPTKIKRLNKVKVQEPCSIRCSTSVGLIPSLQCCICLCLYHPECTENLERNVNFICKNCQSESKDPLQSPLNLVTTPPPLIPISMLNAQNNKSEHQVGLLPKLQRIPKNSSLNTNNKCKTVDSKLLTNKKRKNILLSTNKNVCEREIKLLTHSTAQNIVLLSDKRFIVIPKSNIMTTQLECTLKQDKIADKPPFYQDTLNIIEAAKKHCDSTLHHELSFNKTFEKNSNILKNLSRIQTELNEENYTLNNSSTESLDDTHLSFSNSIMKPKAIEPQHFDNISFTKPIEDNILVTEQNISKKSVSSIQDDSENGF